MEDCKGTLTLNGQKNNGKPVIPEEAKENNFRVQQVLDYYLRETILMCNNNNIPVHIIQLPMGEHGVELLKSTGYMQQYENYMQALADDYGISVEIHIPVYPDELFADNSHLNKQGQSKFTSNFRNIER